MYVTSLISLRNSISFQIHYSSFVPDNSQNSKRYVKYSSVSSILVHLFSSNGRVLFTYTLLAILLAYLRCLNRETTLVRIIINMKNRKTCNENNLHVQFEFFIYLKQSLIRQIKALNIYFQQGVT